MNGATKLVPVPAGVDWEPNGNDYEPRPVVALQQPAPRQADAFRNMFAILHNLSEDEWNRFETTNNKWLERDLTTFVLKLDDARLDALYALVQNRQPERYRGIV